MSQVMLTRASVGVVLTHYWVVGDAEIEIVVKMASFVVSLQSHSHQSWWVGMSQNIYTDFMKKQIKVDTGGVPAALVYLSYPVSTVKTDIHKSLWPGRSLQLCPLYWVKSVIWGQYFLHEWLMLLLEIFMCVRKAHFQVWEVCI